MPSPDLQKENDFPSHGDEERDSARCDSGFSRATRLRGALRTRQGTERKLILLGVCLLSSAKLLVSIRLQNLTRG